MFNLGIIASSLYFMMEDAKLRNAETATSKTQTYNDEYVNYYEISKISPFHVGDCITCEDRKIIITGFKEDSNGNFLIKGERFYK